MRLFRLKLSTPHTFLLIGLLVLSCFAAIGVAVALPPTYAAKAQVVLLGPNIGTDGKTTNPFLQFSPALNVTADVLVLGTQSQATLKSVVAQGGRNDYTVVASTANSEPIITVTGQGSTKAQAILTAGLVVKSITTDLAAQQVNQEVQSNLRVQVVKIVMPQTAARILKKSIEYGVAALVGATVMSLLLIALLDRRRRKRADALDDAPQDGAKSDRPAPPGRQPKQSGRGPRPGPNTRPRPPAGDDDEAPEPVGKGVIVHRNGSNRKNSLPTVDVVMSPPGPR